MSSPLLSANELVIDDSTNNDFLFNFKIDGKVCQMGAEAPPDNYADEPIGCFSPPSTMEIIPRSEWSARIRDQEKYKSRTSDILLRAGIPSTDQNGDGYCWAYSTGGCVQAIRAFNKQKYVRLNPHSVAAIIKKGANQGGWCGQSAEFLTQTGIASFDFWPEHSRDYRKHDTAECRENMKLHRVTEDWIDLTRNIYDRSLTMDQVATCLLNNIPCALDFSWWGHSVMIVDLVELGANNFGYRLRNSWTDRWGEKGFSVIQGSKMNPMGAVALRVVPAARV